MKIIWAGLVLLFILGSGCASDYRWTSKVPKNMRSVAVSVFRNESEVVELGPIMAREALREFQREGTFAIKRVEDAALEVQGIIKGVSVNGESYNRRSGFRTSAYEMTAVVLVSVVDRVSSKVLVDNRAYTARTLVTVMQDMSVAERDASGRLAGDLARQIVDDIANLKW